MASQQFSKLNFLSSTERRFYSRKKPSHDQFSHDQRISKVVKILNSSSTMKKINKYQFLKTQPHQKASQDMGFNETEFIKKEIKAKIQLLLKKSDKKWKLFFQSYEDFKSCSSIQTFSIHENKFFIAFADLLKQNIEQMKIPFQINKTTVKQSGWNKKQQNQVQINLEKIKLIKENEMLRKKCFQSPFDHHQRQSIFNQFSNVPAAQEKSQKQNVQESESIMRLKLKNNQLNQRVCQLQNQNQSLKERFFISEDSLKLMRQDKEDLSKKNAEFKIQNENSCSQFVSLKLQVENSNLKIGRWRAIISFQRQEIFSYESELISIKNQYKDLMRKYKILVKKFNSITNSNGQSCVGSTGFGIFRQSQNQNTKYIEIFREQLETFIKVRAIFNNKEGENTLDKSNTLNEKRYQTTANSDTYKSFLGQKQTLSNPAAVKKLNRQHYAYFKPNFYNFVETYMDIHGIDGTNIEQLGSGFDINCDFLTTSRAILDCKFNDFLNQDFTRTSSLAIFTYGWLSKYKIHRKQKKIIPIKGDLDKDVIPTFFMNLMSQRLNYNWQIITFREFLMQTLTLDELYFYLMARNYIMQGGLLQNISGVYQEIYYISITQVLNMLQKFISDVNLRKKVQEYMKRFIIYVRKRPLIDVHFVLRILLEYYQSKKHQEFTNLGSLALLLSKEKVANFTFETFLKIFEYNFNYLSMTQKLQIYKKSFSCSRGKINLEVILTVLTEEGYLCKEVKKMFCNDPIVVIKDQRKAEDESTFFEPDLPEMMQFEQFYQKFCRQSYDQIILNMGLEHLDKNMELMKEFNQTNIFQRIQSVFSICLSTIRKAFYTKKISLTGFLPILQETMELLKRFSKVTCEKKAIMDLMTYLKRDSAAKKILRFYRKKRNQMHRNFIFGVEDQVIEEDEKIQGLRKDFNFMIENLKDRFSEKKIKLKEV